MKTILKITFISTLLVACDKVGEIIDEGKYEKPVINSVDASPNNVNPGDTVTAIVEATNPEEGLLTYSWSAPDGGLFIQPANHDTAFWIAPFTGKTYTLKVTIRNEQKSNSGSDEVTVVSSVKPLVNVSSPTNGSYFVQNEDINIILTAYHDNSLAFVRLFVNDIQQGEESYNASNNYTFSFKTDSSMIGDVPIKVVAGAFDQPGNTGFDLVVISVEAILPKRGGI